MEPWVKGEIRQLNLKMIQILRAHKERQGLTLDQFASNYSVNRSTLNKLMYQALVDKVSFEILLSVVIQTRTPLHEIFIQPSPLPAEPSE